MRCEGAVSDRASGGCKAPVAQGVHTRRSPARGPRLYLDRGALVQETLVAPADRLDHLLNELVHLLRRPPREVARLEHAVEFDPGERGIGFQAVDQIVPI